MDPLGHPADPPRGGPLDLGSPGTPNPGRSGGVLQSDSRKSKDDAAKGERWPRGGRRWPRRTGQGHRQRPAVVRARTPPGSRNVVNKRDAYLSGSKRHDKLHHGVARVRQQHEREQKKRRDEKFLDEYDQILAEPEAAPGEGGQGGGGGNSDSGNDAAELEAATQGETAAAAAVADEVPKKKKKGRRSKGSNDAKEIEQKKQRQAAGSGT